MTNLEEFKLIELTSQWIAKTTGTGLDEIQKTILKQVLAGEKLKDIQISGYSSNTIQRDMAPKLWKRLSDATGKKVSVKTVHLVLQELKKADWKINSEIKSENFTNIPYSQIIELPWEPVPIGSPLYIERTLIETPAYEELRKPGSVICIKAPKKMGKTSLMMRLLHQAKQEGWQIVALNFELAEREIFTDLDKFLQWFCAIISYELELEVEIDKRWSRFLGSSINCTNYMEKYILPNLNKPLVLGLDAVDRLFPHQEKIADDFFALLRFWHEEAKTKQIWKNFHQVIVHGTEVYVPKDIDQSPFNIGLPVVLSSDFDANQVNFLAQKHDLELTSEEIENFMELIGGHPYLVRLAFYKMIRENISLKQIINEAATASGIYANHLRIHLRNLKEQYPELIKPLQQVVISDKPVELNEDLNHQQAFKLNSMGLVNFQGDKVIIRNNLYRQYFQNRLNLENNSLSVTAETKLVNVLAAIVFTDAKDSTYKGHINQQPTLAAIFRDRNLMTEFCHQYEGKVLKSIGDGLMMYFTSVVKAVECAKKIQQELAIAAQNLANEDVLDHRIGIHLAEVFFDGIDIYGDGVNIASRLQSQAEPGGICISTTVYEAVKSHLQLEVSNVEREIKGIGKMLLYQVTP